MHVHYVYLMHEAPIAKPYYCKVGFTDNPQRRLAQLQAGNPRYLRSWCQSRRPVGDFGFKFPSREHAYDFEQRILDLLNDWGVRLRRDYDYERDTAEIREWIEGIDPDKLGVEILKKYEPYVNEKRIAHLVAPVLADYQVPASTEPTDS